MYSLPSGAHSLVGETEPYQIRKRTHSDKYHKGELQGAMRGKGDCQGRLPGGSEQKKDELPGEDEPEHSRPRLLYCMCKGGKERASLRN